jgi:hypothetical protein
MSDKVRYRQSSARGALQYELILLESGRVSAEVIHIWNLCVKEVASIELGEFDGLALYSKLCMISPELWVTNIIAESRTRDPQ